MKIKLLHIRAWIEPKPNTRGKYKWHLLIDIDSNWIERKKRQETRGQLKLNLLQHQTQTRHFHTLAHLHHRKFPSYFYFLFYLMKPLKKGESLLEMCVVLFLFLQIISIFNSVPKQLCRLDHFFAFLSRHDMLCLNMSVCLYTFQELFYGRCWRWKLLKDKINSNFEQTETERNWH